jgi:hypothetical protein
MFHRIRRPEEGKSLLDIEVKEDAARYVCTVFLFPAVSQSYQEVFVCDTKTHSLGMGSSSCW